MTLVYFAAHAETQVCAVVAELVDAPDSKSGDGDIVPVRVRPSVPDLWYLHTDNEASYFIHSHFALVAQWIERSPPKG